MLILCVVLGVAVLVACSAPPTMSEAESLAGAASGTTQVESPVEASTAPDGPHAAADRQLAPVVVSENASGTARISEVDLGNVSEGGYTAPLRGILVTPTAPQPAAPLIVLSHLRAPNCDDGSFAYPCPTGTQEYRFDRGMTHAGERLAEAGYAVLIPDLGGIFVGSDLQRPYRQDRMWSQSVGRLLHELRAATTDATPTFGVDLTGRIDLDKAGLLVHSRSAGLVATAQETIGVKALKSVFAYGPAYDDDAQALATDAQSPGPPDIAYLAVVGDLDADVGPSANLWLGHYLGQPRHTAALVAAVPGFGHMLVNRTLSEAGLDDRIYDDAQAVPDAAEHEKLIGDTARTWFDATVKGADNSLPVRAEQSLPETIAGAPVRWLAATPDRLAHIAPNQLKPQQPGSAIVCRHADPMNPIPMDNACPEPARGVVQSVTDVNHLRAAVADLSVEGARGMAIHLSRTGSHGDAGTTVTITLHTASGTSETIQLDPLGPVLKDRVTSTDNGTYLIGTVRLRLPESLQHEKITRLEIDSPANPVEVAGIDFMA